MIDLHCHSACSDGADAPESLPIKADALGLVALALTDHDSLDGLDSFLDQQPKVSARLVPGIELSCRFAGQDLHVLGLFINHRDTRFIERIESLKLRRQKRNKQILQNLADFNINLLSTNAASEGEGLTTRLHIAEMLLESGQATSIAEAFNKYIGEDGMAYVPFDFLSPTDAFKWIMEAGGLPIIAHPGRFIRGFVWDKAMAKLRDDGAVGIEAYHSDHSDTELEYFLRLCETLNMLPSGGSDYHGDKKLGCELGKGWGSLNVPNAILDSLLSKLYFIQGGKAWHNESS